MFSRSHDFLKKSDKNEEYIPYICASQPQKNNRAAVRRSGMDTDFDLLTQHMFISKKLQRDAFRENAAYLKGRVLDIGCGSRPFRRYLACSEYVGIDGSPDVKPELCASIISMPFNDGSFDGVMCTEVLEHVAEPAESLKEIGRVLKGGGYLYLTVPQSWGLHYEPHDYWRFTKYGISYLLEENGFKVVTVNRIGGICSMAGQEIIDAVWTCLKKLLLFTGSIWSERLATGILLPLSMAVYVISRVGDKIDKRYALDWVVVAVK